MMRLSSLLSVTLSTVAATALLASGCAQPPAHNPAATASTTVPSVTSTPTPQPTASRSTLPAPDLSATASGSGVAVYDHPRGHLLERLANPIPEGAPLTFLVAYDQGAWLEVYLAQRPNGSTGWVTAGSVTLHRLPYRLKVSTETNTMTLVRDNTVIRTFSVATGTGGTPTPHGSFYITELLAPQNPGYGPYAFGLSAYSTALSNFGGGPGQIGLHGTDDAASIGKSASHGCIRLHNSDITTLAKILPLGTPITVS